MITRQPGQSAFGHEALRSNKNRKRRQLAALMAAVLAVLIPCTPARAGNSESDMQKIETLIGKYERSVSNADITLASEVWAQGEEVSFIHPQGQEHGWKQIKEDVYEKLMRDVFSERNLTARNISIHVYQDSAWAEFQWVFVAKLRSNGSPVRTEGRETQVYHRSDQGWRLVHVHYSALPAASQSQ
jgi:hypothetical protein